MKQSLRLQWRALVSKFRQPPTPKESQQLLKLLNDSFRRDLDRKHRQALSNDSLDHHLSSILDSPLFSVDKDRTPSIDIHRIQKNVNREPLQVAVAALKDPPAHFKQQISMGAATIVKAKFCLNAQLKVSAASKSPDPKQHMKESRLGSLVYDWLWSSGLSESMGYLDDPKFLELLMPFLTVEAYQDSLKNTLLRLLKPFTCPLKREDYEKNLKRPIILMTRLIMSEIQYGANPQSAVQLYLSIWDDFEKVMDQLQLSPRVVHDVSRPARLRLVSKITRKSQDFEDCGIESALFDRFLQSIPSNERIKIALLNVYHPCHPNPSKAVPILRALRDRDTAAIGPNSIDMHIRLGLKTADVFSKREAFDKANEIMQILHSKFATELGLSKREAPVPTREEEEVILPSLNSLPLRFEAS